MNFTDLINDIEKLSGLYLKSIRKGSEIYFIGLVRDNKRIVLKNSNGKKKSRPLSEIETIWEQLCRESAVHVESALRGSGSSRNQPETIFANLPYIEWFMHKGKKHIGLVSEPTHHYGTLKKMDDVKAEELRGSLDNKRPNVSVGMIIVVSDDISETAEIIKKQSGLSFKPVLPGIYRQEHSGHEIMIVSSNRLPNSVHKGTYFVIKGHEIPNDSVEIMIDNLTLYVLNEKYLNIMIEK